MLTHTQFSDYQLRLSMNLLLPKLIHQNENNPFGAAIQLTSNKLLFYLMKMTKYFCFTISLRCAVENFLACRLFDRDVSCHGIVCSSTHIHQHLGRSIKISSLEQIN